MVVGLTVSAILFHCDDSAGENPSLLGTASHWHHVLPEGDIGHLCRAVGVIRQFQQGGLLRGGGWRLLEGASLSLSLFTKKKQKNQPVALVVLWLLLTS